MAKDKGKRLDTRSRHVTLDDGWNCCFSCGNCDGKEKAMIAFYTIMLGASIMATIGFLSARAEKRNGSRNRLMNRNRRSADSCSRSF